MQGRFKRDGSAAAESEPRGGSDRGQSTQHARNTGPAKGRDKERAGASPTASTSQDGAAENAEEAPAKSSAPTGPGSRIALRNWRISTRLVALLTLPVVAATSLGAMRINSSMDEIEQLDNMKLLTEMTKHATRLATALQNERDQSAGPLTHGGKATDYDVRSHRENTDRARQVFLEGTRDLESADEQALDGVRSNVRQITSQLYTLGDIRKEAYQDDQSVSQTIDAYSQLIEQLLDLSTDMAQATSNPDMIQRTRALAAFSSAKEYASIQRAVIAAALPANDRSYGELSETDRRYGSNAFKNEEGSLAILGGVYDGNAETLLKPLGNNATITEANAYAKRVLTEPNGMRMLDKRSYRDWLDDASAELDQMQRIETTLLTEMEQKARELRNEAERDAYINGALIFLVLGVSLVGAFVVSRSMIRSLRRLPGHRDQGRPGAAARAGPAALRVGPAGRGHLGGVRGCALARRDRQGGRGLRRRAPRGGPPRRRPGAAARQRQRDVHQPLAPQPGPDPASALAHLRAGVPRGRPGPALLALQARPPRDPHAP